MPASLVVWKFTSQKAIDKYQILVVLLIYHLPDSIKWSGLFVKMRLSKKTIDKEKEKGLLKIFFQLIADIKNPAEAEKILTSLLTKTEILMITKRLAVTKALKEKVSYSEIRKNFQVSSATISQISSHLNKNKGIEVAMEKISADQWAEKWATKIKNLFGKV